MTKKYKAILAALVSLLLLACIEAKTSPASNANREAGAVTNVSGVAALADSKGEPAPPSVFIDTTLARQTGRTIAVGGSGAAASRDFQTALESAKPGDTIALQAGATFTGNFTLPKKAGSGWVIIRTSATDDKLPPPGTRITPAHAVAMPKLVSPNADAVISTAPAAHHYRFIGVEFTVAEGWAISHGLILLGDGSPSQNALEQIPHDLIIDRCYIHGNAKVNLRRGIALNSAATAIIDSHIAEVHEAGADSQAICGWNGPGPFRIVNNFLSASGENVMFGGADPKIKDLVPSDIEFRNNYCVKPRAWNPRDPSYGGAHWSVKNLFELKNARRVLIEGNTFENHWVDAQAGPSILFTARNQEGTAPWSTVEDVTFKDNVVRNVAAGVSILGIDDLERSQQTRRIKIYNNLFAGVGAPGLGTNGRLFQLLSGASDIIIDHNTAIQTAQVIVADGQPSMGLVYTNNITAPGEYGIFGDGASEGHVTLSKYFPGAIVTKNVFTGRPAKLYPPGNFFTATLDEVGFADPAKGNYRLSETSRYRGAGTDGRDIGCDMDKLRKEQ